MKRYIILTVFAILLLGCKDKEPAHCYEGCPKYLSFHFTVTDENGKDLFFGKESIYNPEDAKYCNISYAASADFRSIEFNRSVFHIGGYALDKNVHYTFLLELRPEQIDTIYFKPRGRKTSDGCDAVDIDVFFNNELICTDCDGGLTYKLIKR